MPKNDWTFLQTRIWLCAYMNTNVLINPEESVILLTLIILLFAACRFKFWERIT